MDIVSLHLEPCNNSSCNNRHVCYHVNKDITSNNIEVNIEKLLSENNIIYESICSKPTDYQLYLLSKYNNYNITLPCYRFLPIFNMFKTQIQLSIYNYSDLFNPVYLDFIKLYLVYNDDTLNFITNNVKNAKNVGILIDENYINKTIASKLLLCSDTTSNIKLSSCLMSWFINNECPYQTNYLDITYDGSIRTCPYSKYSKNCNFSRLFI